MDWFILDEILRIATGLVLALLALVVYFMPSIVAIRNQHPSAFWIFLVNLAFGAVVVGWIVALIWALMKPEPPGA